MSESLPAAITAHLWQSTLVAGLVWLATLTLRRNRPRVRYWLWAAASVKFLVPFSWLVSLGAQFEWKAAPLITLPAASFVVEQILAPPATMLVSPVGVAAPSPAADSFGEFPWALAAVWMSGSFIVLFWWAREWLSIRTALRNATPLELGPEHDVAGLEVRLSSSTFEPGVIGVWRPILLLPKALVERLTTTQLRGVIAHERCHIRCRDNLVAAVHMLVEALFWFHPLVWWLEGRLIQERERACDEAVLIVGNDPADYAESILTVCRLTVRAPLACVAGVGGAELRTRIESIVRNELGTHMTFPRRVAVVFFGLAVIGVPIVAGVVTDTPLLAVGQEPKAPVMFEVAAVKVNKSGQVAAQIEEGPGGRYTVTNASLRTLILRAYQISDEQLIGAAAWARTERFDINAKLEQEPPAVPRGESTQRLLALRSLLAEHFNLVVHRETRQFPMYALVFARSDRKPGPQLTPASGACSPVNMAARNAAAQAGKPMTGVCGSRFTTGRIQIGGRSLSEFVKGLSGSPDVGRGVIDRTGLTGDWDIDLTYTPDRQRQLALGQEPPPFDPNGPSLFTALQEQLGLRLQSIQGPMEVLVVDRLEQFDAQDAMTRP